jgi:hypothetical protein
MAKFTAYCADTESKDIMIRLIDKYPTLFGHIVPDQIGFVMNLKKKSSYPIKVRNVSYPNSIWNDNVYIVEVFQDCWATLEPKQRNLAVAQAMCNIHTDGFSETSKNYGKIIKPNISTFLEVFSMAGGIPNWLENASVSDPLQ